VRFAIRSSIFTVLLGALASSAPAAAQTAPNQGFQLNRYEPTAAGEWSFAVDHPWYSSIRYFAAGVTLNYAHKPLVIGALNSDGSFNESRGLVDHQFIAHIDLAGSFLDRVLVTASLPLVLLNDGQAGSAAGVGDPRLGAMVRVYGQPYESVFSASVGLGLWIPLRAISDSIPASYSDKDVRVLPKVALGGVWNKLLWSGTVGFMYRPEAETVLPAGLGAEPGRAAAELQFGLAASYWDQERRFAVGPEILIATAALGRDSFSRFGTSLEAMIAGHYNVAKLVQVGLALGTGFVRQPGTPDFRGLLRVAYAPTRSKDPDRDGDGIKDRVDACPDTRGVPTDNPRTHGCPPIADRDLDGVPDSEDRCPDEHKGSNPDPARLGCPMAPPEVDRDGDGVLDKDDQCPDTHKGQSPDPNRNGCPAQDSDKDGVVDPIDQCLFEPAGLHPDPNRIGCPLPDRDKDTVPDKTDACPDKPGAPNPNPKKNGCPSLVEVRGGQLVILKPVFFATDKDVILNQSFAVLQAVADVLAATPEIKRIRIEGHTDSQGKVAYNVDLSNRRANSVMRWLVGHGISAERLEAKGYGPERPVATNNTAAGRAKNRRVEFHIAESAGVQVQTQSPAQMPTPAQNP
jgi:outer membrane protein OmpA-like peptidoglycan-associated protein